MIDQPKLPKFENVTPIKCAVQITKAGDGLSAALSVAPEAMKLGTEHFFILRTRIRKVAIDLVDDVSTRIHTAETIEIVEVDEDDVKELIHDRQEAIRKAKDEQDGQGRIWDGAEPTDGGGQPDSDSDSDDGRPWPGDAPTVDGGQPGTLSIVPPPAPAKKPARTRPAKKAGGKTAQRD